MLRRVFAVPDLYQRSCNDPYHIIKKSCTGHPDRDQAALFFYRKICDRPNRGLRLRMNTAEAFEIMLSDKISCCRIHPVYIQLCIGKMCIQSAERIRKFVIENPVFICFLLLHLRGCQCGETS